MPVVNMLEAKTNLSRLVNAVESGVEHEIVIARNGRPAARLVAIARASTANRLGLMDGKWRVPDDIYDYEKEIGDLFGARS